MMTRTLTAALAVLALGGAAWVMVPGVDDKTIHGQARVVDGDSLVIDGKRVRLFGVDAPEIGQRCGDWPCGLAAKAALERIIGGAAVSCIEKDKDRYGRSVATCSTPTARDLGALLVATGNATDYKKYSHGRYADEEAAAKAEKLGIWRSGEAINPEQYRREKR